MERDREERGWKETEKKEVGKRQRSGWKETEKYRRKKQKSLEKPGEG